MLEGYVEHKYFVFQEIQNVIKQAKELEKLRQRLMDEMSKIDEQISLLGGINGK